MPLKTSSKEVKCNTKIKEYRDGSYTITRSDRHIFKDPAFEYHCKHEHSIDERSRQEQLKRLVKITYVILSMRTKTET